MKESKIPKIGPLHVLLQRMLDILLLTILTEKDEVERTSALVFLEEHGESLVWDEELSIRQQVTCADNGIAHL